MKKIFILLFGILFSAGVLAQTTRVKGRVFDAYNNNPLAGASVQVTGGSGTTTAKDGSFSLECTGSMEITVSYLSYVTYKQNVTDCGKELLIGLTPSYINLNEIEISSTRPESNPNLKQPQAIGLITRRELTRSEGLFLENSINLISGVRYEKRTQNGGQRITIRGYGNSTNFNGTGYKAYLNGIPVTDAEGATILDDIDFSTLGKIEVIKGPASSLYGTGIGGVVKMYTLKPEYKGTKVVEEALGGSFGLFGTTTRIENATDNTSVMLNYGHQRSTGYRIHTDSKKDFISFAGDFRNSDKQTFSVFSSYTNSYNELAGQLDSASFFNKLNVGETPYLRNGAHVGFETYREGVSHSYVFNDIVQNTSSIYFSGFKQSQASAAGLNDNMGQNYGARTEFTFNLPLDYKISLNGVAGLEFNKSNAFKKTYSMVNKDTLIALTTDLETATSQYSVFTQWDLKLPSEFTLTAGASLNFIEYGITDRLTLKTLPTHSDQSGYKRFDPVVTPRIALAKSFGESVSVYGQVSMGYSAPTSSQVIIPYLGEANTGLKPEKAIVYEIGSKGSLFDRKLSYQIALFKMIVSDKLTSQSVTNDSGSVLYTFTTNAGKQDNQGLEVDLAYTLYNNESEILSLVRPFASATWSDFRYKDFKSNNNNNAGTIDYTGKKVSGVPSLIASGGLDLEFLGCIYLYTTVMHVDKMPITYDNAHYAPAYTLLNMKLGYRQQFGDWSFEAYAGGDNLTSELYYHMVFLNSSFAGAPPALYLPGSYDPLFYGGLNVSYRF